MFVRKYNLTSFSFDFLKAALSKSRYDSSENARISQIYQEADADLQRQIGIIEQLVAIVCTNSYSRASRNELETSVRTNYHGVKPHDSYGAFIIWSHYLSNFCDSPVSWKAFCSLVARIKTPTLRIEHQGIFSSYDELSATQLDEFARAVAATDCRVLELGHNMRYEEALYTAIMSVADQAKFRSILFKSEDFPEIEGSDFFTAAAKVQHTLLHFKLYESLQDNERLLSAITKHPLKSVMLYVDIERTPYDIDTLYRKLANLKGLRVLDIYHGDPTQRIPEPTSSSGFQIVSGNYYKSHLRVENSAMFWGVVANSSLFELNLQMPSTHLMQFLAGLTQVAAQLKLSYLNIATQSVAYAEGFGPLANYIESNLFIEQVNLTHAFCYVPENKKACLSDELKMYLQRNNDCWKLIATETGLNKDALLKLMSYDDIVKYVVLRNLQVRCAHLDKLQKHIADLAPLKDILANDAARVAMDNVWNDVMTNVSAKERQDKQFAMFAPVIDAVCQKQEVADRDRLRIRVRF